MKPTTIRHIFCRNLLILITMSWLLIPQLVFAITADELIAKVKYNREQISDLTAFYTQKTTSSFMPTQEEKGKLFQKGKKTRKETQVPSRKLYITTETFRYEKDLTTQKEKRTNLEALPSQGPMANMDIDQALDQFNFGISNETNIHYILNGELEMTEIELQISKTTFSIDHMLVKMQGNPVITIQNEYEIINSLNVLSKSNTAIQIGQGQMQKTIQTVLEYKVIKINQSLRDELFKI